MRETAGGTMITPLDAFGIVDLRIGTVVRAYGFPEARTPAMKLEIDFGEELGIRRSSAQITRRYSPQQLVGRQVVAAVNLGERRIAGYVSQVLILGGLPEPADVVLLAPDAAVPNGTRIG